MSDEDKEQGLTTGGLKTGSLSDRPENSKIKQATPASGLQTGSLSDRPENSKIKQATPASGLQTGSIKDKIAEQYEPALSGSEGPRARFDTLRELINTEIGSYESGKVVSSNGDVSMQGFGQFMTIASRKRRSTAVAAPTEEVTVESRLDLVSGTADGTHKLRAPKIVSGVNSIHTDLTITNGDLTLAAGKWLVFEVDDVTVDPFTMTVALVDEEVGGGLESYTFHATTDALTAAFLPIYKITSSAIDTSSILMAENIYATRFLNGEVLVLSSRFVQVPSKPVGQFVPIVVPL